MGEPEAHIAAWESAGLIDPETAARLRAAGELPGTTGRPGTDPGSQAAAMIGPGVTIPEVFGYLGSGFLLAGWTAFVARLGGEDADRFGGLAAIAAAAALVLIGFALLRGDARRGRAAGIAFLVAVAYAAGGVLAVLSSVDVHGVEASLVASAVGLALAAWLRAVHPAVLTQIALLGALTAVAASGLALVQSALLPEPDLSGPLPVEDRQNALLFAIGSAAWWLAFALIVGLLGLRESRRNDDPSAARRAAVTRFWAGVAAVVGLWSGVTRTTFTETDAIRVIEPWMGELAIVVLSIVLLERAFRRDSTAYVYAAALGLIIALSDFNFTYLSDTTEVGLVIEGAILLGVGLAADRLRRRIRQPQPPPAPEPAETAQPARPPPA